MKIALWLVCYSRSKSNSRLIVCILKVRLKPGKRYFDHRTLALVHVDNNPVFESCLHYTHTHTQTYSYQWYASFYTLLYKIDKNQRKPRRLKIPTAIAFLWGRFFFFFTTLHTTILKNTRWLKLDEWKTQTVRPSEPFTTDELLPIRFAKKSSPN